MGGRQQVIQLIRKDLLPKKRRPEATCFELSLPAVLFVILVLLRKQYNSTIQVLGPYYYEPQTIFPLSRELSALLPGLAGGLTAGGAANATGQDQGQQQRASGLTAELAVLLLPTAPGDGS